MSENFGDVVKVMALEGGEDEERQRQEKIEAMRKEAGSLVKREIAKRDLLAHVVPVDDMGDYVSEADDPNVLIYGPWLERGGSAFWVSTAGTGKSIGCMQMAHAMSAGKPFCGLRPRGRLKFWIFQSEDSSRRLAQDRIDVRAELAEQYPDEDWNKIGRSVKVVKLTGKTGVVFLREVDGLLTMAAAAGEKPDVIVLNPFLAFVGGPIVDGGYITPFLRGGIIEREYTEGLQALLERHGVGVLIFHHTPKPPNEKELKSWMTSAFPEYQGSGSSDLTNWGRSFVTMMKVPDHPNMVCVTAGKNGAELGWDRIGGAFRRYMAYSSEIGISGRGRHAWRDLTDEELAEVTGDKVANDERQQAEALERLVGAIKTAEAAPIKSQNELVALLAGQGVKRAFVRMAADKVLADPAAFRLTVKPILHANRRWLHHIGLAENIAQAEQEQAERVKLEAFRRGADA